MITLTVNNRNTCFLKKRHDNLGFLDLLYLWQTIPETFIILAYLDSIEDILKLVCHSLYIH